MTKSSNTLFLLVAVVVAATLLTTPVKAAEEPPTSWNEFTGVAYIDKARKLNYFVNAPLYAVDLIASFLDLNKMNSEQEKANDRRQCDIAIGIRHFPMDNGTLLIVTNQSGAVPKAVFDTNGGGEENFFEAATQESFGIVLEKNKNRGIWFQFTLVCALMPAHSTFSTLDALNLPVVFPNAATNKKMKDAMDVFASFFANGKATNATQLQYDFNLVDLNYTTGPGDNSTPPFTPINASSVVPSIQFAAIATRLEFERDHPTEFLVNAPLRALAKFSLDAFPSPTFNDPKVKAKEGRTCDFVIGIVRPEQSNTVAVVTDASMIPPYQLFQHQESGQENNILGRAISNGDVSVSTNPFGHQGVYFHFTIVCAELSYVKSSYQDEADVLPPIVITPAIEKRQNEIFNSMIINKYSNGKMSNEELEQRFNLTSLVSSEFFPQHNVQPERPPGTPTPAPPGSNPTHLTTGGKLAIAIAVIAFAVVLVVILRKYFQVKEDGDYERVMA